MQVKRLSSRPEMVAEQIVRRTLFDTDWIISTKTSIQSVLDKGRYLSSATLARLEREFGVRLGVGRSAVYELLASGQIGRVKIGRRTLVPVQGLRDWVDRNVLATDLAVKASR